MRRLSCFLVALLALGACATSVPEDAYYPNPADGTTRVLAAALHHAARSASEDPEQYSFAMLRTPEVRAYTADDATFYFSDGLARQPRAVIDALIAHEVAHELLDHTARRRALSPAVTGVLSRLRLLDFVTNSPVVRAYTRDQEMSADLRAVELLRDMGYHAPRRTLADALRTAATVNSGLVRATLATEPELEARLSALEPLEPIARGR